MPLTEGMGFELAAQVHQLASEHERALQLLGEIIGTMRLPANRFLVAKKLPEAEPVMDSFIRRYAAAFEKKL